MEKKGERQRGNRDEMPIPTNKFHFHTLTTAEASKHAFCPAVFLCPSPSQENKNRKTKKQKNKPN